MMNTVCRVIFVCSTLSLISFNVFAVQNNTLFLGKLDLRAKQPITELSQISSDLVMAGDPYFFDRNHLYFTQTGHAPSKKQKGVFVWDLSKNNIRSIMEANVNGFVSLPLPADFGSLVIRQKDNNKGELRTININGVVDTHLIQYQKEGYTSINAHQFEKSNWYLYTDNRQQPLLKAYNTKSQKTIVVSSVPQGSEYFSVSATGHLIVSDGIKLYQRQIIAKGEYLQSEGEWSPMVIESTFCQSGITKTAISPYGEMIALVCAN